MKRNRFIKISRPHNAVECSYYCPLLFPDPEGMSCVGSSKSSLLWRFSYIVCIILYVEKISLECILPVMMSLYLVNKLFVLIFSFCISGCLSFCRVLLSHSSKKCKGVSILPELQFLHTAEQPRYIQTQMGECFVKNHQFLQEMRFSCK